MATLRIRLEFDDPQVLSEAQISEGLRQSWVQLKPEHEIIFDVSSYIIHIFDLHDSCPDGIVLSIDGFVLPPFESIYIIKDKDVVRIGRKRDTSSERVGNLIEEEATEKLPTPTRLQLSAGDDFEKDAGTDICELEANQDNLDNDASLNGKLSDEHIIVRKRKASGKLQSSKKKRKRVDPEHVGTEILTRLNESCPEEKSTGKKKKVSDRRKKSNKESTATKKKGSTKPEGTDGECVNPSDTPDGIEKVLSKLVSSRGAKRRSAKLKWWRALPEAEREELVAARLQRQRQIPRKIVPNKSVEHLEEDSEGEGELVPVITKPGCFRFQRLKKSQAVQQSQKSTETNLWNGSTSKSGQEQGNGNPSSSNWNKTKRLPDVIDFDKLAPFTRLPKKGDVIAYRLLELNSTWTPELSPFRVGKTSWYNPQSHKLLLRPVPGHPIYFKKKADEDECAQRSNSLYNEDRSLVIKFSSLIDVRLVKASESKPENSVKGWFSDMNGSNGGTTSTLSESSLDKQAQDASPENEANPWDKIAQTASNKKPEPDGWEPWGTTSSRVQSVNAWMNASSGTPPGNGRGNTAFRPQPGIGWSKSTAGHGRGNSGSGTQPGIGWSKSTAGQQSGRGRGTTGFRAQPGIGWSKESAASKPPGNSWGNSGSGKDPANSWGKGGFGTQPGNGSGNAGPGTQPGNAWSKLSSSKGWGNAGSANGWGNGGPRPDPANSWRNGSSGTQPGNGSGNAGPGTNPGNGWSKPSSGTPLANGWGNGGSRPDPAIGWRNGSSSTQTGNGWGNAGPGTQPANAWGKPSSSKGWGNAGSGPQEATIWGSSGSRTDSGAPPGNGWGNAGSGSEAAAAASGSSTLTGNDSGDAGPGDQPGNGGSGTGPGNGWTKASTGAGKWSGKG